MSTIIKTLIFSRNTPSRICQQISKFHTQSTVYSQCIEYDPNDHRAYYSEQTRVGIIGAPIEKGQMKTGVNEGPKALRENGLRRLLLDIGVNFKDYGNIPVANISNDIKIFKAHHTLTFLSNTLTIKSSVSRILKDKRLPLVLGGDHSIATGSIMGHALHNPDMCIIWVDAHADINTPLASRSGNFHGMPLAFLVEEVQEDVPWIEELKDITPCIPAANLVYIGLRDVDPYERYLLRKHRIRNYTMHDIDKHGMYHVIHEAISYVNPRLTRPIHLSFDIDALDPLYARSTGTSVSGGLSLRDAQLLCEEINNTGKLAAMDLVEVNPQLGSLKDASETVDSAIDVICSALGKKRAGHLPPFLETPKSRKFKTRAEGFSNILRFPEINRQ